MCPPQIVRLERATGNAYAAFCGGPEPTSSTVAALPTGLGVIPIDGVDQIESRRAT
jgi:hypothetical protein